jgi:hypothetical protein
MHLFKKQSKFLTCYVLRINELKIISGYVLYVYKIMNSISRAFQDER